MPNKMVWFAGMVVHPEHFDLWEDCLKIESRLRQRWENLPSWGFFHVDFDRTASQLGILKLNRVCGCFPDGTLFSAPEEDELPEPLTIHESVQNQTLYLICAEPIRQKQRLTENCEGIITKLQLQLTFSKSLLEKYSHLPLLEVESAAPHQAIIQSRRRCAAYTHWPEWLREDVRKIIEALQTTTETELQIYLLRWQQFASRSVCHPQLAYELLQQNCGALSNVTHSAVKPFQGYDHMHFADAWSDLLDQFIANMQKIRSQKTFRVRAVPHDRFWVLEWQKDLKISQCFIGIRSEKVETNMILDRIMEFKVASLERIQSLITYSIQGIPLQTCRILPKSIREDKNTAYFMVPLSHPFWEEIRKAGCCAIHTLRGNELFDVEIWITVGETHE